MCLYNVWTVASRARIVTDQKRQGEAGITKKRGLSDILYENQLRCADLIVQLLRIPLKYVGDTPKVKYTTYLI